MLAMMEVVDAYSENVFSCVGRDHRADEIPGPLHSGRCD